MKTPELIQKSMNEEGPSFDMRVPETIVFTEGHFPEVPVVPGVVLLDWAIQRAREEYEEIGRIQEIEILKFKRILQPGDLFTLDLAWDAEDRRLTFHLDSEDGTHATGRIKFSITSD